MWHENARPLIEAGQLILLGVVQEQHAERARLYRQWKQFDFPILQDASNSLNLTSVPVPILIDEHGIVRDSRPNPGSLTEFVDTAYAPPQDQSFASVNVPAGSTADQVGKLIADGNRFLHARSPGKINEAIETFRQAVKLDPDCGKAWFSLGVAYRTRFDSNLAQPSDFREASRSWSKALATNPNQYIWRRRIEQYGPRSAKPYPFYNWMDTAIADIRERGETPVPLKIALSDSELAKWDDKPASDQQSIENPDPDANITVDEDNLISLAAAAVPSAARKGENVQVHLRLTPRSVKWNGEAGPLRIWIDETSHGSPGRRLIEHVVDEQASLNGSQSIDFNFKVSGDAEVYRMTGFVLFHACDDDGVCFYHRKNFEIDIPRATER